MASYALVIDPHSGVAESVAAALVAQGYEVGVAVNLEQAQALFNGTRTPDLLVAHFQFHEETGENSIVDTAMKANPLLPAVIISAHPAHHLPLPAGRWVYLAKPFGLTELLRAVSIAETIVRPHAFSAPSKAAGAPHIVGFEMPSGENSPDDSAGIVVAVLHNEPTKEWREIFLREAAGASKLAVDDVRVIGNRIFFFAPSTQVREFVAEVRELVGMVGARC